MKTIIIAASLLLATAATSVTAQTTPGYDRPAPSSSDHQHVVYWSDSFDHYDMEMQIAADAFSLDDLIKKGDRKEKENYERRHKHSH